jgi:hypothetical protein
MLKIEIEKKTKPIKLIYNPTKYIYIYIYIYIRLVKN